MNTRQWLPWAAMVLVVILMTGCSSPAAPVVDRTEDNQVEALAQRVAELEAQLEASRWTEKEAITVVQFTVRERLADCDAHSHEVPEGSGIFGARVDRLDTSESGGCNYRQDLFYKQRLEAS